MSEILKNIETCRGEDVLAEVSAAPQDPHFGSLVNEALDPLKQQALHQAGYDGYSEVIEQHKPYTFASFIAQMKSNLLLLLRALWQFPFGSGTSSLSDDASLRSLSDMWSHYITRLQGNETYGIPSRLSSLTDLPSAPLLVADRKISGVPAAADGISLVNLLTNPSAVTEITDDNVWTTENYFPATIFPNLEKVTSCLKEWYSDSLTTTKGFIKDSSSITEISLPLLKKIDGTGGYYGAGFNIYFLANLNGLEKVLLQELEYCRLGILVSGNNVTEIVANKLVEIRTNVGNGYAVNFVNCPKLRKLVLGKVENISINGLALNNCTDLIHLEFGEGVDINLTLAGSGNSINWSPTNALDASLDTLVTDEDCHNNLEQFLKNFRTYIALRLTDNGSGKTLTLSAAVFSSIWDANGNPQVLGDGLDQLRADIHNIVKTTKHWDVNKAS